VLWLWKNPIIWKRHIKLENHLTRNIYFAEKGEKLGWGMKAHFSRISFNETFALSKT